ncbi:hypothetical protein QJS04_geneDACA005057 [Acorus gramineus]|uniref:Polyribonucleotide nucleotidyltransferase 2, mitochondrial n=1 Tax=Acorus gramineus TaxID=55184 RepID=A0AAV9AW36_ACOGR|nr:hypothetical protein QJS04_geneDACA005057 [Acorus gramineus]
MAALATRTKPLLKQSILPHLTWRRFTLRSLSSGLRLGFPAPTDPRFSSSTDSDPSGDRKVLETFTEEFEIGSKVFAFETGKLARFANGSVVASIEETRVLSTVASSKSGEGHDFLPLTVDYQEKQFAQGVIPTTFMRREGAPKERELLCGRLIDRPIRPLFPAGFYNEVQIIASVLSSDGKQDPDVMAANAASAALMLSDIPWGGPIGVIRLGRTDGQIIFNPDMDELSMSDLNLVYACTWDKTLMIDVQAREISERDLEAAMRLAHPEAVKFIEPQVRLAAKAGKLKKDYKLSMVSDTILERISGLAEKPIEAVFTDATYGKFERGEALENIAKDVRKALEEECDEEDLKVLPKAVDTVRKKVVRRRIIEEGKRVDGRCLDEVRPLYCESGAYASLHGSAIFSRGDTQVLCTVTLGAPDDAQRLDSIVGPPTKRFMLHYSFPPFSTNEIGKRGGLNRREVGHGTLAEKALLAVLPPENDFPYTVRINSEVMASDGSTSMASVCGGSMALMDAGIPLREHVAGVSVGLVTDVDPSTGMIKDYRILTDILGLEDHLGDMDFKIAGTRKGVTAIQLDIKPAGIPLDIICESLEPARKGRLRIIDHMEQQISAPRTHDDRHSPRIATLKFSNDSLQRLIGLQGSQKKKIERETGARLYVSDGTLTILAKNQNVMEKAQDKIDFIIGREIEVGGIYKGVVVSIKEYGAFVEFNGGQQGLLHMSEMSHEQVSRVSDVVSIGQELTLMCIEQNVRGDVKLSLKATLPKPESATENSTVEDSASPNKPTTDVLASEGGLTENPENANAKLEESSVSEDYLSPSILIRSVEECNAEENAAGLRSFTKAEKSAKNYSGVAKVLSKIGISSRKKVPGMSSVIQKQVEEHGSTCENEHKNVDTQSHTDCNGEARTAGLSSSPKAENSIKKFSRITKSLSSSGKSSRKKVTAASSNIQNETEERESTSENEKKVVDMNDTAKASGSKSVNAKMLKIGDRFTAKVHQIRLHGLVLKLGGGVHGMYRFEENGKRDFDVGEELHVECLSFSAKGIPVVSLVEGLFEHPKNSQNGTGSKVVRKKRVNGSTAK